MASTNDSFSFEYYELIPRDETLQRPKPDKHADINTKPYVHIQIPAVPENVEDLRVKQMKLQIEQHARAIKQKDDIISQLKAQSNRVFQQLKQQKNQINNLNSVFTEIKQILGKPELKTNKISEQIKNIISQLQQFSKKPVPNIESNQNKQNYQSMLMKKQQQIRHLKNQLFESTSNNINAIFNTELSSNQCIFKEIQKLSSQFQKLQVYNKSNCQCKHEQKVLSLIKKYQQMLQLYHSNQKFMHEIKAKQQENFTYFSSAKVHMTHSIFQACSNYTNERIKQIQLQIKNITDNLHSSPQKVKTDQEQDVKAKQLIHQIQHLNEKIKQKQIQVQKMREANQQLLMKSRAHQNCGKNLEKLKNVQIKLKQKQKRIQQLQSTIIDHIDSRAKDESFTSQDSDVEKQKMTIRNLKAIVSNLKQENKNMKSKLSQVQIENVELKKKIPNISSDSDKMETVEKVSRDEASFKVVEDIVGILISSVDFDQKCKCLERTTDCLLNLNEEYPELQGILEELGVIQKTSNLLPIQ